MIRSGHPRGPWQAVLVLSLALLGLAFTPVSAITDNAVAEQRVYALQRGTPAAIPNFIDLAAGCNWSGIGGQIFDLAGSPRNGMLIKINGTLEGRQVLKYVYTGSSQYFGPGGFNLKLVDHPVASQTLSLQLLDAAGEPRSAAVPLTTYATCQQNLLVVNLVEVSLDHSIYLPFVSR